MPTNNEEKPFFNNLTAGISGRLRATNRLFTTDGNSSYQTWYALMLQNSNTILMFFCYLY